MKSVCFVFLNLVGTKTQVRKLWWIIWWRERVYYRWAICTVLHIDRTWRFIKLLRQCRQHCKLFAPRLKENMPKGSDIQGMFREKYALWYEAYYLIKINSGSVSRCASTTLLPQIQPLIDQHCSALYKQNVGFVCRLDDGFFVTNMESFVG